MSKTIRDFFGKILAISRPYKVRQTGTANAITIPPSWIRLKSWLTDGKLVLELIEDDKGNELIVIRTAGGDEE